VTIESIAEAEAALRPYVPLVTELTGKDTTLDRIAPLIKLLGDPQKKLRIVHIAGTSGKTSTAYYMAALLKEVDQKVGLTVSPHVDSITERVQINGEPLTDDKFCEYLSEFLEIIADAEEKPSYFELLYAFALWVFAREKVDYAVVETGVGGLHDATNAAKRADKVCIITDIGFDHMTLLGNTLAEIAAQKIGIVHPGNEVFTYKQVDDVMQVFEKWCNDKSATLNIVEEQKSSESELPQFQERNWNLAYACYQYLQMRDSLQNLTRQEISNSQQVIVPGRMQQVEVQGKTIIMDGAHNEQKLQAFISSFRQMFPDVKPAVLLALKIGKEYSTVTPLIADLADSVIVTTFDTTQDLPAKAIDPNMLAQALKEAGTENVQVITAQKEAVKVFLEQTDTVGVITGSFYLLSQIRNAKLLS